MIAYRSRAPLRLGLAGGGTDIDLFYRKNIGYTLNSTIDLFAQCILEPIKDKKIIFEAKDLGINLTYDSKPHLEITNELPLHQAIYNRIIRDFNNSKPLSFRLITYSDSPPGAGLGSSSTMVIAIIKVFSEWLNINLTKHQLASLAYDIERKDLKFSGGKQDQYAAAYGGFNFIKFGPSEDVEVNSLEIKSNVINELESSLLLFYTGKSRKSSQIIDHQIKTLKDPLSGCQNYMSSLKKDAFDMRDILLEGKLDMFSKLLLSSWKTKKKLSSFITNKYLEEIYETAMNAGAISGKISGAGGGGFFIFFVPLSHKVELKKALLKFDGELVNFNFNSMGAESWKSYL